MNWLERAQLGMDPDEAKEEEARQYFGIGHGDFNEEVGFEPTFVVWAYLGGRIVCSKPTIRDPESGEMDNEPTHGSLWGHEITDQTYKGRYEPETGRISIVRPASRRNEPIPSRVMNLLHNKFKIKEVFDF